MAVAYTISKNIILPTQLEITTYIDTYIQTNHTITPISSSPFLLASAKGFINLAGKPAESHRALIARFASAEPHGGGGEGVDMLLKCVGHLVNLLSSRQH